MAKSTAKKTTKKALPSFYNKLDADGKKLYNSLDADAKLVFGAQFSKAEPKKAKAKATPVKVYIDGLTGEEIPYFKRLEVQVNGNKIRTFVDSDAFWKAHKKGKALTEKANA